MATQVHPYLQQLADEEAAKLAAESTEEVPDEETSTQEEPEPEFYQIPKSANLYRELTRLAEEDESFRNNLNTLVGRKAKKEYQTQISALEAELAEFKAERARQARASFSEEELGKRLKDPEFAQAYHSPVPDAELIRARSTAERIVEDTIEGVEDVLTPDEIERFRNALTAGHYDVRRDENEKEILFQGQPVQVDWQEAITQFNRQINRYARYQLEQRNKPTEQTPAAESKPVEQAPVKNRLAEASPDLSATAGSRGMARMSMSEYKRLNPRERIAMFKTDKDFENAVREGTLYYDE